MEKVEQMSHEEDIETGGKHRDQRRVSVQHGAGDRALDLIGDDYVELTDEDVGCIMPTQRLFELDGKC